MKYKPEETMVQKADNTIQSHGKKVAFSEEHPDPSTLPPGKETEELTFEELNARSNRIANRLTELGAEKGDVVSYQIPNWVEFPLIYFSCQKIGAVSQPILPEHRSSEVGFMTDLTDSDILVIPSSFRGFDYVSMVEKLLDSSIDPAFVFVIGDFQCSDDRFRSFDQLKQGSTTPVESPLELDDLAHIMFTSGTTGEPKGVRHTVYSGMQQILPPNGERLHLDDSDVIFASTPLAHTTGYQYCMRLGLLTGARTVLFDKWIPERAVETISQKNCTFCAGATTFLKDLLDLPNVEEYPLSSLQLFYLAGSAIPEPIIKESHEKFGNMTIVRVWGQTENGMVTATKLDDPVEKIATTDGAPLSHAEVTVRNEFNGAEVRNETGKLLMRGESLMDGYHKRPTVTEESFTDDGWFKTGDLAIMYDNGYISIEGRQQDFIIRGGMNISALEVEEHVLKHPVVQEVAVVAMPDERLQERPCAFIQIADGHKPSDISVDSLSAFLDDSGVQVQKHPEHLEITEKFPRTSTGKIQKFKLEKIIASKFE